MSDWLLALASFLGYEVIALITARQVYKRAMFTRYDYRGKERHAGKAWGVSQLWGPALILAPPAGACTLAGFIIYGTCLGLRNGMRWFIKTESLDVRHFQPHKITTEALEAECGRAGKDLATLQGTGVDPEDYYQQALRRQEYVQQRADWLRDKGFGYD